MAKNGEFSRRAFENGKMDLPEIEGLADLIEAQTEHQHTQAMRQMEGGLSKIYNNWRQELIEILAQLEAVIDFPDEEIPTSTENKMNIQIKNLIDTINNHLNDNKKGERLRNGLNIAIIGSANAGKSTLLNHLTNNETAIVSHIAGTTRDVLETQINFSGYPIIISDTAGIRKNSNDIIEKEGIKRAINKSKQADLLLIVIDANNPELQNINNLFKRRYGKNIYNK